MDHLPYIPPPPKRGWCPICGRLFHRRDEMTGYVLREVYTMPGSEQAVTRCPTCDAYLPGRVSCREPVAR